VTAFKATRVGYDTTMAQMIALVDEAASSKAPIAKLADKVAGVFVPAVICIALVTAAVWMVATGDVARALTSGVAVLVISCPCALGLATPVAIMVGTGKGAENGILFKSAEALETLRSVRAVVLDKTGTITQGKPMVTDIKPFGGMKEAELLCVAASLEKPSEHPLAQAVLDRAQEMNIPLAPTENFQAVHGRGVTGTIQGGSFLAGNQAMMEESVIDLTVAGTVPRELAEQGKTPLYFAQDGKLIGIVAVADTVKPTSAAAIKAMRQLGLEVVMLTGDNLRTAKAIAKDLDLTDIVAEVLPQDKEKVIAKLQAEGKKVAMIGDGINDAPALARSDVGLAIGAGTDVAIESADVVLMKSDLLDAVTAVELSRATIRNIKQNLFWAFFYNAVCIPVAAGVLTLFGGPQLNPMIAAAAMSMSAVCVVSNALRLKLFKPRHTGDRIESPKVSATEMPKEPIIKKEETTMTKTVIIEGMMCQNCVKHATNALNALPGVTATVNLESKTAIVTGEVTDEAIKAAIAEAGYEVTNIQ
ncbi:MAG: heavy metal translocating P-type ATPase, partial [Oscillospiraceae bacterium]|nr:heavy metal translocating P-type ATPase [Oscillospiraceae bacterium]